MAVRACRRGPGEPAGGLEQAPEGHRPAAPRAVHQLRGGPVQCAAGDQGSGTRSRGMAAPGREAGRRRGVLCALRHVLRDRRDPRVSGDRHQANPSGYADGTADVRADPGAPYRPRAVRPQGPDERASRARAGGQAGGRDSPDAVPARMQAAAPPRRADRRGPAPGHRIPGRARHVDHRRTRRARCSGRVVRAQPARRAPVPGTRPRHDLAGAAGYGELREAPAVHRAADDNEPAAGLAPARPGAPAAAADRVLVRRRRLVPHAAAGGGRSRAGQGAEAAVAVAVHHPDDHPARPGSPPITFSTSGHGLGRWCAVLS